MGDERGANDGAMLRLAAPVSAKKYVNQYVDDDASFLKKVKTGAKVFHQIHVTSHRMTKKFCYVQIYSGVMLGPNDHSLPPGATTTASLAQGLLSLPGLWDA